MRQVLPAVLLTAIFYLVRGREPVILSEKKVRHRVDAEAHCEKRGGTLPTLVALERRNLEDGFKSCRCGWAFKGQVVQVGCHENVAVVERCDKTRGMKYPFYCQVPEPSTTPATTRCVIKKRWPAILTDDLAESLKEAEKMCQDFSQGRIATQVALQRRNQNQNFKSCECGWAFRGKLVNVGCEGEGVIRECERDHRQSYKVYCLGDVSTTTEVVTEQTTPTETVTEPTTAGSTTTAETTAVVTEPATTTSPTTTVGTTTSEATVSTEPPTESTTTTTTQAPEVTTQPEVTEETSSPHPTEVIDDTVVKYKGAANVFHLSLTRGHYLIKNIEEAELLCEVAGGTLATPAQLQDAWKAGMDNCFCGWLSTGQVRYPINIPKPQCATTATVATCPPDFTTMQERGWDAYCYQLETAIAFG